jgi:uncharacterized protein involved in response to NO
MKTSNPVPSEAKPRKPGALDRLRSEPYRILFPLGLAGAAIGIGIWIPYYFLPGTFPYPGQGHAVIQIQGFLLCFVFGFLTTMLPKVMGVNPLDGISFSLMPLLLTGVIAASLLDAPLAAQSFHLAALGVFLIFAARRFPARKADPPPNFLFIAAAMLVDLAGTLLKIGALSGVLEGQALRAGALLQYQAFPLLLILGVGGFLLPKLFANGPIDPKALRAGAVIGIRTHALLCALFLGGFLIEILGLYNGYGTAGIRAAYAVRAFVWAWFLIGVIRIQKVSGSLPPYLQGARISMVLIGVGLAMPIALPGQLIAWEHVVFIAGFLQLTLSVASRVLAAHAGRLDILSLHGGKVRFYGMLLSLAMITRILTEFWPAGRWLSLAVASGFALAALLIWGRLFIPLARTFPGR